MNGLRALAAAALLAGNPAAAQSNEADDLTPLLAQPQRCADGAPASLAGPLRLAQVLRAAICNHAGVRKGLGLSTQAQAVLDQARAQARPSWSLSTGLDTNLGSPTQWGAALNVQWVLFDFGRQGANILQARQALAAALDELRAEVLQAVGNAALLYAASQAAFGRLDAANVNLRIAGDSARLSEARQSGGASTLSEMLLARTALAQARLERTRALNLWLSARGALAVALRLPANTPLEFDPDEIADENVADLPVDFEALVDEARRGHPLVTAARARLEQAQARAASARAERWGRISLTASSGRSRPSYGAAVETTRSAGISWSVPLFDGGLLEARQLEAQGQIQAGQATLDDALGQIELQVWQQAQALMRERAALRDSRAVLDSAEGSMRVAGERFRYGVGSFGDVLTAQNAAAGARYQLVEAQANLRRERLRLAAAVGRFGALLRF